jgi:hypothetical protein
MNTVFEREIFKTLKANNGDKNIMPFVFRSELALGNNSQIYEFPILAEDSVKKSKTESRINKNDTFFMTSLSLQLVRRQVDKEALDVLQTYPNSVAFPDVAGQFDHTHLEAIYNGKLQLEINTQKILEDLSTSIFREVPETLQVAGVPFSQKDRNTGVYALPKHVKIYGSETNKISLTIPTFTGMKIQDESALATIENRVVLVAYGFLIKGAKGN